MARFKEFLVHFMWCAVICSAVYLPTTLAPFERHDDYLLAHYQVPQNPRSGHLYAEFLGHGRFLMAEVSECFVHPLNAKYPGINFFILLRIINLFSIILAFSLLSYWISSVLQIRKTFALLATALIVFLPGFQVFMALAISAIHIFSLPLALLAIIALRDRNTGDRWQDFCHIPRFVLSVFLVYLVLITYQVDALIFFFPSLFLLLFGASVPWPRKRLIVVRHLLVFMVASVFFILIQKLIILPVFLHFYPGTVFHGYGNVSVTTDVSQILSRIGFSLFIPKGAKLWFINNANFTGLSFIIFILFSVFVFLLLEAKKAIAHKELGRAFLKALQYFALIAIIFIGLQSTHIFFKPIWYFRILVYYSAFIVIFLIWSLYFWIKLINQRKAQTILIGVLGFFVFATGVMAQQSTYRNFAAVAISEIDFLEGNIQEMLNKRVSAAVILRPLGNVGFEGDEHGMLTSCFDNEYGLLGMMKRIYQRNRLDASGLEMVIGPDRRLVMVIDRKLEAQGITGRVEVNMDYIFKILLMTYR